MHTRLNMMLVGLVIVFLLGSCGVRSGGDVLSFQTVVQDNNLNDNEPETPQMSIIGSAQEIDDLIRESVKLDPQTPDQRQRFVDKLRQLDYTHSFAVLITQGQTGPRGFRITVQQITRQDDQVTVQAEFVSPKPDEGQPMMSPEPYTLVAVAKEATWGQQIQFELVADGKVVAEAMHFIP